MLNCRIYCPALKDQIYISANIKECLELKAFKQYSVLVETVAMDFEGTETGYFGAKRNLQFLLSSTSKKINIFEEVLIIDFIGLVGSIGGSLGLFVGFSFFGYVTPILDAVFDRVASFFLRIN